MFVPQVYWRAKDRDDFLREVSGVKLGASISKIGVNTDINPKMPYLSFLAINYNFDVITEVQKWFESCIIHSYNSMNASRGMTLQTPGKQRKNW